MATKQNWLEEGGSLNPVRAAVPFWGQTTWDFEWNCPHYGTAVLKGLTGELTITMGGDIRTTSTLT